MAVSYSQIRGELIALCDDKQREFNLKLIPTGYPMLGVKAPLIEALARRAAKECPQFLSEAVFTSFEDVVLYGFTLAALKLPLGETLERFLALSVRFDNWAHVDLVTSRMKVFNKDLPRVSEAVLPLKTDAEVFRRRTFVIVLMDYFITDAYADSALSHLAEMKGGDYYVDMAVAWALSVALVKFWDRTVPLLKTAALSKFTHNKTIQKACESRRLTDGQKAFLRTLKV